jgi:hypothetical protein
MAEKLELDDDGVPVGAPIVPARITTALDARELYGPDVDLACGTFEGHPDGDVDDWELGRAAPTRDQVRQLAALTGVPVPYFFEPLTDAEHNGAMWVCGRSGPNGGGRRVCRQLPMVPTPPAAGDPPHRQGSLF